MKARLRITYLLEDTAMFGGVKVALRQANLMAARGHRVTIVTKGQPPDWIRVRARMLTVPDLRTATLPDADVTVATYWPTIEVALRAPGQALHYCQGFEALYTHNQADHPAILDAYGADIPAMTVSPHLTDLIRQRFGRAARTVPQPLEGFWRPAWRRRPGSRPRILVTSPFEIDWKGVPTALDAIRRLRERGVDCRVVRLSQWPLSNEERRRLEPDTFHCHVQPRAAARIVRDCDLHVAPSREPEGFGLPVLESMASGVPVVASNVDAFRGFTSGAARLVEADDAEGFAKAAAEILSDAGTWRRMRRAGRDAARRFDERRAAEIVESTIYWAASAEWEEPSRQALDDLPTKT